MCVDRLGYLQLVDENDDSISTSRIFLHCVVVTILELFFSYHFVQFVLEKLLMELCNIAHENSV